MRRKKGDGSFSIRNGYLVFRVNYGFDELTGKRIRKTFTGKTEKECRKKAKEWEDSRNNETISIPFNITLSEWIKKWIKIYKEDSVSYATYIDYKNNIKIIENHSISKMKMTEIKPIHIKHFYNDCQNYSKSVLKKLRFILNSVFQDAIENDICIKNPTYKIPIPQKEVKEKEIFTNCEVSKILNFVPFDPFGLGISILLLTGMRSGELRALLWDDVHLDKRIINISKAINRSQEISTTKNKKTRIAIIPMELYDILKNTVPTGKYVLGNDSFMSKDGFESRYKTFFNHLNNHLQEIESEPVKYHSPHIMRHTYDTMIIESGVPKEFAQELLGHLTPEMTEHYLHIRSDTLIHQIDKIKFL